MYFKIYFGDIISWFSLEITGLPRNINKIGVLYFSVQNYRGLSSCRLSPQCGAEPAGSKACWADREGFKWQERNVFNKSLRNIWSNCKRKAGGAQYIPRKITGKRGGNNIQGPQSPCTSG